MIFTLNVCTTDNRVVNHHRLFVLPSVIVLRSLIQQLIYDMCSCARAMPVVMN